MADQKRLDFEEMLKRVTGIKTVYFQAPDKGMKYPCIKYKLGSIRPTYADNGVYLKKKMYEVTYIDKRPDSDVPDKLIEIPMTNFVRSYTSDYLNHYIFEIYY